MGENRTCCEQTQVDGAVFVFQEVRIGPIDVVGAVPSTSVDLDEVVQTLFPAPAVSVGGSASGSPPQSAPPVNSSGGGGGMLEKAKESHTPPSSPNINNPFPGSG